MIGPHLHSWVVNRDAPIVEGSPELPLGIKREATSIQTNQSSIRLGKAFPLLISGIIVTYARSRCHPEAPSIGEYYIFADIAHKSIARVECPCIVFCLVSYPCLVRCEISLALRRKRYIEDIFGM